MNQKAAVAQAPNGPLTWIWYLVIFAFMSTLGVKLAAATIGQGAVAALVGTTAGLLATYGIAWLWRQIPSLTARLILGIVILVVVTVATLVAQALQEYADDRAAVTAPTSLTPQVPWEQYQPVAPVEQPSQLTPDEQRAQTVWNDKVAAWAVANTTFLQDATRKAAMGKALDEVEESSSGRLTDEELISQAQAIAFQRTGWTTLVPVAQEPIRSWSNHDRQCNETYQETIANVPADVPIGEFSEIKKRAERQLNACYSKG